MSDDERDDHDHDPAESAPPRPKKKKKKRRAVAAEARPSPPPAPTTTWTGGHVVAALAIGAALGGLGGYVMWGRAASPDGGIAKDNASAPQAPMRGAQSTATALPRQPQEPAAPVYIALAGWSPREGPEHAKVTILEFSDFQ